MSKPRPKREELVRALADEMYDRLNAILAHSAARDTSEQFVVLATDTEMPVDGTSAYGPFGVAEALAAARALRYRFAATYGEGRMAVTMVPWVALPEEGQ